MKQTVRWVALLLAGAMIFAFAACKRGDDNKESGTTRPTTVMEDFSFEMPSEQTVAADPNAWRLVIRGGNISEFTDNDAKFQQLWQNVPMTVTDTSYGITITHQYTGITLKSIMEFVGVPPSKVQSVNVTSITGKTVNYSAALALDEGTLLAWEEDGSPMQGYPPLKMCTKSGSLENYVDLCASIDIITLAPGQTNPFFPPEETLPTVPNTWIEPYYPPYNPPPYIPPTTKPTTTPPYNTLPTLPTVVGSETGTTQPTDTGTTQPTDTGTTTATGSTGSTGITVPSTSFTLPTQPPVSTTKSGGGFTYNPNPTTKAPTLPSVSIPPSTAPRTTHTFPAWADTPERKKNYDNDNGLEPNYPPDY